MPSSPIRIIIVDDHTLARESWKSLLDRDPNFEVIALCENGITAIEMAQKLLPDIMLVDMNMYPLNGFAVTQKVLETNPEIKIIGLSVNNEIYYPQRMLKLGAKGYITKTSSIDEVTLGIMKVFQGEQYICDEIKSKMSPIKKNPD